MDLMNIDWTRTSALGGGIVAAVAAVVYLARRGRRSSARPAVSGQALENLLTFTAAGVATGVAAVGMWRFFGDVLHIESIALRIALFAFLEVALFVSALRARRNLLEDLDRKADAPSTGLDGKAVWALAVTSGAFSAMDARSVPEATFRLTAPLVAAWLWERGLAAHRRRARGARRAIHWALTPERVMVWLRLAEPTDRTASEVDAARRRTRLVRASVKAERARGSRMPGRAAFAEWRFARRVDSSMAHLNLGQDAAERERVLDELATRTQASISLTASAVAGRNPWGAGAEATAEPATPRAPEPAHVPQLPEAPVSPGAMALTGNVIPVQDGQEVWVRPDRPLVAAAVANHYREIDPALTAAAIGRRMGRGESTVRSYFRERTGSFPIIKANGGRAAEKPAGETPWPVGFQAPDQPTA